MAGKKPDKSKLKPVSKDKKSGKEKKSELKAKVKAEPKKAVKAAPVRLGALEKAKAKVRTALEKVVSGKAKKAAPAAAAKVSAKATKPLAPVKQGKGANAKPAKIEKAIAPAKLAKGAEKLPKGMKALKKGESPAQIQAPAKKGKMTAAELKAEALAKKHAAAKNRCREVACESEGLLQGYCRLHYIKNWRRIKKKDSILSTGQLDGYVEELVAKYPDKYLDAIENDLHSEKEWAKVITDLELGAGGDEDFVSEEEDGAVSEATGRGRGGFDDEDEDVY